MTTPENNPVQPPNPDAGVTQQTLEELNTEVQGKTVDELIKAVKDTADKARDIDAENDNRIRDEVPAGVPYEGSPADPNSKASKAAEVKKAVQSILLAVSGRAPKTFTPEGITDRRNLTNATDLTRALLKNINEKVGVARITEENAPYFHRLMQAALSGEITSISSLGQLHSRFGKKLAAIDTGSYGKLHDALIKTGLEMGFKDAELRRVFMDFGVNEADRALENLRKRGDFNETKIIEVINRDKYARDTLELGQFYAGLETAEKFNDYYKDMYARESTPDKLASLEAKVATLKPHLSPAERRTEALRMAKENTAKEINRRVIYMVNLFFKPVLVSAPDQQFREAANKSSGLYSPSPENMFTQLTNRITGIMATGIVSEKGNEHLYMGLAIPEKDENHPQQRTRLKVHSPMKEYVDCDFDTFALQMKKIADTERGFMEYGHNFRFATNKGRQADKGFFETIQQFAKESITSADIDVITSVEYSELVQVAKMQLERRYKLAFAKAGWKRDITFIRRAFQTINAIDKDIRDSFIREYSGTDPGKFPEVIIDRSLSHARTLIFGKEFNLHLWASYADPRLEKTGKPTYSREELAGAAAFHIADDMIRWGEIDDLTNNGEVYLPTDLPETDYDNMAAAVQKGKTEFYESFTFGYAAFEKAPPTIAVLGNICKGGGMDALGGYRVNFAYRDWLNGLLDERTDNKEINVRDSADTIMVDSWKRVENIGINVLKNFTEDFVAGMDGHKNALMLENDESYGAKEKPVTKKYEALFGFWYDRYFADPDGVGQAYINATNSKENAHYKSREAYVAKMMEATLLRITGAPNSDKLYDKERYKLLSVILFERSPLEFISMEKRRNTQNGVTLLSELQNEFDTDPTLRAGGRSGLDIFDEATDDLVYVEQKARMDTIQQMHKIREADKMNLFGDMTKDRSAVLQDASPGYATNKKGGYVIDVEFVENALKIKYGLDDAGLRANPLTAAEIKVRQDKIAHAKRLYTGIKTRVLKTPDHNSEIDIYPGEGGSPGAKAANKAEMAKKLKKKEGQMQNRMEWWADEWRDGKFGMTFMGDTADQFLDRDATGEDTVANAAEYCANTAEALKDAMVVNLKVACKKASLEKKFDGLYEHMKELKSKVETQDQSLAFRMTELMGKRIINAMRKGKWAMRLPTYTLLSGKKGSISETYTGEEDLRRPWSWDRNDIADFVKGGTGPSSGRVLSDGGKDNLRKFGHAKRFDVFLNHYVPLIGLAGLAVLALIFVESRADGKK